MKAIVIREEHDAIFDGSDRWVVKWPDNVFNWAKFRLIIDLPFFEVSWTALMLTILVVLGIAYANQYLDSAWVSDKLTFPIPIPERSYWVLLSSILLAIGSTVYKVGCPRRIQEFTETHWVEQLGHARLLYLAESLKYRSSLIAAVIFTLPGAAIGSWLVVDRIYAAGMYILTTIF